MTACTAASPANAPTLAGAVNVADYEEYSYDANGNRTALRKRDGSMIGYAYDALNRMTSKVVPERAGLATPHTRDVYYGYDLRGLMTSARFDSPTGEGVTTQYEGFGRITASTLAMNGASRTLSYQYDANGNRTRVTFPDGGYVRYQYDGMDRPILVGGNATDWSRSYGYSAAGFLASETLSGTGGSASYGRDAIGRLQSLTRNVAGTSGDFTNSFTYNASSQVLTLSKSNTAYAWTGAYNVNRSYTANGLNQYSAVGGASFCHDRNGNLTADGSYVYLYDVENRLVEKRDQGSGNTSCTALSYAGSLKASLRYDPLGRLYESNGLVTGTTRFLTDGDALVAEYDASGNLLRRYVHGADGKSDDPVAWYEGSVMANSALRFLHGNHQGSVVLASDLGGTPTRLFTYDEYGITRAGDGAPLIPANGARFGYTGQAWLPDMGMYHYKARMYSPSLGRFMQTDPIGYGDGLNWYAYVGNDPINHTDPSGLLDNEIVVNGNRGRGFDFGGSLSFGYDASAALAAQAAAWAQALNATLHNAEVQQKGGRQSGATNPCNSLWHKSGDALEAGGKGVTYSGLAIAALGAFGGPEGAAPGIHIADYASKVSAAGQVLQDIAFDRPAGEIIARGVVNTFGARLINHIVPKSVRNGLGDALFQQAVGDSASGLFDWLDPERCPAK